ncbi:hypothetical protein CAEBREN_10607 [Caenorhabditis brenneri]|uniref:Uncharacterized protein n=1 Tax=Caenorhabditis brenneri TaxID=135651 RepID=G0MXA9_CAEBE|nr:hypothetical protein CAEBREN_10607 [Caenorhabditis brenneri]
MAEAHPALQEARPVEGQDARNALRLARQHAIREGRYLPPLPHLPIQPLPPGIVVDEAADRIMDMRMEERRRFLLENLQPPNFQRPAFFQPRPEDNYRPLSPTHSDEESEEEEEILELQRRIRRDWRQYMARRADPIPQEMIDRLLNEHDQWANAVRQNNNNNNNNIHVNHNDINFHGIRNFDGMLSPSPSLSPAASPAPSEDMDPQDQAREDDDDIEMLNVQFFDMRPNVARPRKRQNSEDEVPIKRKRVTFADDSADELVMDLEPTADCNDNIQYQRKQFDDDDEGFVGGPSSRSSIFCA